MVRGYLLLGLGAFWSYQGDKGEAQKYGMEALDTVRSGTDDRAAILIHAHMDFEVEHIMNEVSTALELSLRQVDLIRNSKAR